MDSRRLIHGALLQRLRLPSVPREEIHSPRVPLSTHRETQQGCPLSAKSSPSDALLPAPRGRAGWRRRASLSIGAPALSPKGASAWPPCHSALLAAGSAAQRNKQV